MITKVRLLLITVVQMHLFYSIAQSEIPQNYYAGTENLTGENLKAFLNDIIQNHTVFTYTSTNTDTWDILKESDVDPNNPSNVIEVYSGRSVNGSQEYNGGAGWSREHVWPQSRGGFNTNRGIGTDLHNLKPVDISVNSARGNRFFDIGDYEYIDNGFPTGSKTSSSRHVWEPRDEVKGDIARIIFYIATRYEGENGELDMEISDIFPADDSSEPLMALLGTLKTWHEIDPVDAFEANRNNVIFSYQGNRNPFIDHPEFVARIWGPTPEKGLFISEYVEGDSYNKAIEIFNNSEYAINLSDVKIQRDNGGNNSFSYTLSLSGTLEPKSVFVVCHNSADIIIRAKADLTTTSTALTFNGDDQVRLVYNGIVVDHVGLAGNYGENRTFVRAGHVMEASDESIDPEESTDWLTLKKGTYTYLGTHYTNETIDIPKLFVSEYIEGSNYNKAIEIYNGSDEIIDLSEVSILKQTNGAGGFSGDFLSGQLNPKSVFCYVNADASTYLKDQAHITTSSTVLDFNGNDPLMMAYKGVGIEVIGNSGGSNFAKDVTLYRDKMQVYPNASWQIAEWHTLSQDDFSNFGLHEDDSIQPYETLFAISSGSWTDPNIWSNSDNGTSVSTIPNRNTQVIIKGFEVSLSSVNEVEGVIIEGTIVGPSKLIIDGGDLSVYGDVKVLGGKTNNAEMKVINGGSIKCL